MFDVVCSQKQIINTKHTKIHEEIGFRLLGLAEARRWLAEALAMVAERSFPGFGVGQLHAHFYPIKSISLGLIHRGIGDRDQELGIAVGGAKSNSDAYGEGNVIVSEIHAVAADRVAYAFCKPLRQPQIAIGCDNQEFLASITTDQVVRTQGR